MSQPGHTPVGSRYHTRPIVVAAVSGYVPEEFRGKRGGIFSPLPPGAREDRVAVPTREVVCYECGEKSQIPAAALSAHCVHCRAHLNASDIELKAGAGRLKVRTLGDVTLPAHVSLAQLSVLCRNMLVAGRAEGTLQCSGTLTLRGEGCAGGSVQADMLVVAAGSRVQLVPGGSAVVAKIEGHLTGRVHATDYIHIARGGVLVGDCRTPRLILEPGARHYGTWIRTPS